MIPRLCLSFIYSVAFSLWPRTPPPRNSEHERHRHPLRRHGLGRVRLSRRKGHSHAEHRFDRQERRALHAGLRLRSVLQPDASRLADRPLPDALRPRVQQHRAPDAAWRLTETTIADRLKDARLRDVRHRQVAPRPTSRSTGRSSAASTSSTARSPTRRSFTRRSSSIRACRRTPQRVRRRRAFTRPTPTPSGPSIGSSKHKDKPWFLYLPFNAQHAPLQAPQKYLDRFTHDRRSKSGARSRR